MRRKLGPWLTGAVVHAMGDRYEGEIACVVEQEVFNRWKSKTTLEDVIVFTDGMQLPVGRAMNFKLMDRFGYESTDWVGKRIVIVSRPIERTDAKTGEISVSWERVLLPPESPSHSDALAPARVAEHEPDLSDPIGAHDEDDIEAENEARRFARKRR